MSEAAVASPGALYLIGGAEDKLGRRTVLSHFVAACRGDAPTIAVIPTASSLGQDIVDMYAALLTRLGAGRVVAVQPETREAADDPDLVRPLEHVDGIFLTGGNQLKLASIVNGTALAEAITTAHRAGVVVGGTSAGASYQSEYMVAFGGGGSTPRQRMTQMSAGLGLIPGCVVDQHFSQRNRYGRLISLVAQSPNLLGIGVDEDTAAVVRDQTMLEVVGSGVVTLVDGRQMRTSAHAAKRAKPLLVSDARFHILPQGAVFDLRSRSLVETGPAAEPAEVAELRVAEADMRELARTIATEGDSSSPWRRRTPRQEPRKGTA